MPSLIVKLLKVFFHVQNPDKNTTQNASFEHSEGKLFGGRAPSGEGNALIIKDPAVSRTHFCIEAGQGINFLLSNISSGNTIVFEDGKSLAPGSAAEFATPNHFVIGGTSIFIQSGNQGNPSDFFSKEKKASTVFYSLANQKFRNLPLSSISNSLLIRVFLIINPTP